MLAKVDHRRHTVTVRAGGVEPDVPVVPQDGTVDRGEAAVDGAEVELLSAEPLVGGDEQDATLDGDSRVDPSVVAEIRQRHG